MEDRDDRSVLIYCPDLPGHRQIYCDVLTDFFLWKGLRVVLAIGGLQTQSGFEEYSSPYIEQYRGDPRVAIAALGGEAFGPSGAPSWHAIRSLQRDREVQWTFFVDGDALRSGASLIRTVLGRPRLLGKNCAIFLDATFLYYPIPSRGSSTLRFLRGLVWWSRMQLRESLFYRVILRRIWDFDVCFFPDGNFVQEFGYKEYHYLPEIHRSFRFKDRDDSAHEDALRDYHGFLRANSGRDVVLYFGNAEQRKGYDSLLKLVHDHEDLVFVHCGRHATAETYDYPVDELKEDIKESGRLFEFLNRYVTSQKLIDELFSSCKFLLLPYRNHYKSSGILIQAVDHGKPVLVPDVGLMNSLLAENGIGSTYDHLCYDDFEAQFVTFRREHACYLDNVMRFRRRFSRDRIFAALERGLSLA